MLQQLQRAIPTRGLSIRIIGETGYAGLMLVSEPKRALTELIEDALAFNIREQLLNSCVLKQRKPLRKTMVEGKCVC